MTLGDYSVQSENFSLTFSSSPKSPSVPLFSKGEVNSIHPSYQQLTLHLRNFTMEYPSLKKRGKGDFPGGLYRDRHEPQNSKYV
jgi:hypothetical protein